jgi:hypothetical protein
MTKIKRTNLTLTVEVSDAVKQKLLSGAQVNVTLEQVTTTGMKHFQSLFPAFNLNLLLCRRH